VVVNARPDADIVEALKQAATKANAATRSLGDRSNLADATPAHPAISSIMVLVMSGTGCSTDEVWTCVTGKNASVSVSAGEPDAKQLKADEWTAFQRAQTSITGRNFVIQRVDLSGAEDDLLPEELLTWKQFRRLVKSVILARRIRIVKALTGFKRLDPDGRKVAPHLSYNLGWLPATEIFGEGIFLEFDIGELDAWNRITDDSAIAAMLKKQEESGLGSSFPRATARNVVLHTFSHLLIRQLTFDCGYSSSSLAERIYCNDEMAGIFIYTGTADSEGSLGGLVREGELDRIYDIVKTALFRGQWCSNDPICTEMTYQGTTKQQTSVKGLTSRAGVTPKFVGVKPNDAELMTITGAQEPSGIPYVAPITESRGPSRSGGKRPRPNSSQRRRRPR
jgi:hypothetical protein